MIFFRRKKKATSPIADYSVLRSDVHSHLLPGIDDGSPDLETSVHLIKGMKRLGYKKLITTPHIMWDVYKNTSDIILNKLQELKGRLADEQVDIEVQGAAEYFVDEHLVDLVEQKQPLLSFGNNFVLVEFSMVSQPFEWKKTLFEMQIYGYQPVIAHPERYSYLERNKDFYDELKSAGYLFQLNILSLSGLYGKSVAELARYLTKKGYYDLIGTDLHHVRHLEALKNPSVLSSLQQLLDSGKILNPSL
jgi:protein-tyrosine phosphatase